MSRPISQSLFLLLATVLLTAPSDAPPGSELQHSVIWHPEIRYGQQAYVAFGKAFELEGAPEAAVLHIFADSRYILWVNGQYVERGPNRFDPQVPEYDSIDLPGVLKSGHNAVAVLVHHYHDGLAADDPTPLNGRMMRHQPGLAVRVECSVGGKKAVIETDASWRCNADTPFLPSPVSWGWIPDNIDARKGSGDWTAPEFDDSKWATPISVEGKLWGSMMPRSIPRLREIPIKPADIIKRVCNGGKETFEERRPLASALPLTLLEGDELTIDVGRMVLAYDLFELEASEGADLEIAQGHGYVNGALDETYGANRYVARGGRQQYMSGDTCGFRYMQIRVRSGQVTLHDLTVVNRVYPFDRVATFESSDPFLNELWERSMRTTELCSEDGYTDCSARERVEWMGDAALAEWPITRVSFCGPGDDGNPIFSDPRLIKKMLWDIGLSQQTDGRLKAHHPSNRWDIHGYIEDYTCLWLQALRSYYDYTDDKGLVEKLWPRAKAQLQWFFDHKGPNELVQAREFLFADNPLAYKVCEGMTLNAYLVGTLRDAVCLAGVVDDPEAAKQYGEAALDLTSRLNGVLWDEAAGTYRGAVMDGAKTDPTAHAAMTALFYGIVPEEKRPRVLKWLVDHRQQAGSPYSHRFLLEELYVADSPEMDRLAIEVIRDRWGSTLARKDLDTVFEGFGGGSLCHNMGAVSAYFMATRILGVYMDGPARNRHIVIDPRPGDLKSARGAVMTPFGKVPIAWDITDGAFRLETEVPESVECTVRLAATSPEAVSLDGKPVKGIHVHGRKQVFEITPGEHAIECPMQ